MNIGSLTQTPCSFTRQPAVLGSCSPSGRALGIRVIGTVSDESKAAVARAAGCFEIINYSKENFVERVHTITNGAGVAAVYDAVGRDTFLNSLRTLRPRGTLVVFGKASGDPPPLDPFLLAPKSLYVTWPIRPVYTEHRAFDGNHEIWPSMRTEAPHHGPGCAAAVASLR
jgi:NADPH:quinone reductase-like Zn-dependent oxidoreductase